jgi:multimeric flavodoxin WrbA
MKVFAFNGSPRKEWNTATLLKKALEGAESKGAETELVHLYDLNYKGCISCFSCKTIGGESYGRCAVKDDLTDIFEGIRKSDAIILGSPIYFGTVSGEMRSFMERLMFPNLTYTNPTRTLFPKKIKTGFIYTMNITEEQLKEFGYTGHIDINQRTLKTLFGSSESLFSFDTYQFKDYSQVVATRFHEKHKAKRRKEVFPYDLEKAYQMGVRFASEK